MRGLKECQAEVFRRSAKRIKERSQRRNHILMACIPLVLCITMFSVFILPALMSAGSSDKNTAPDSGNQLVGGSENDAIGLSVGTVEVSGIGVSHYYTSAEDVQEIMGLINCIIAIPGTDNGAICDSVTSGSISVNRDVDNIDSGYQIIWTSSDGTISEYYLIGAQLVDRHTNEMFPMDEKLYFDLKTALGIPLY